MNGPNHRHSHALHKGSTSVNPQKSRCHHGCISAPDETRVRAFTLPPDLPYSPQPLTEAYGPEMRIWSRIGNVALLIAVLIATWAVLVLGITWVVDHW